MAHVEDYAHERNSVAMILITPDEGSSDLDQHLNSIQRQLALIKRDLEILQEPLTGVQQCTALRVTPGLCCLCHGLRLQGVHPA